MSAASDPSAVRVVVARMSRSFVPGSCTSSKTRLRSGELDFGLFYVPVPYADIESEPLFHADPAVALLPHSHPLSSKRAVRPKGVTGEMLVTFARSVNITVYD